MGSRGGGKVPAFDGRCANFLDYKHQTHSWLRAARTELSARALLLVLHMQPAPRQVCLAEGGDISDRGGRVTDILNISRSYFAPGAADAIRQQVV